MVTKIPLYSISAHTLAYNQDYKVLASATFRHEINVYTIYKDDVSSLGQLFGHNSTVTALESIKNTPLFVSCDESGCIKTWDIRYKTCIQTIITKSNYVIKKFLYLNSNFMIGIEKRLLSFIFEDNDESILTKYNHPIDALLNLEFNEMYVCTKNDIRCLDIKTGKIIRVIDNIIEEDSQIDSFCLSKDKRTFIAAIQHKPRVHPSKGKIKAYSVRDGKLEQSYIGHKNEICGLSLNHDTDILISAGWDGYLMAQRASNGDLLRIQAKAHYDMEIEAMKVSKKIGMIATQALHIISLWSYDSFKFCGVCYYKGREFQNISFFEDRPFLMSLDKNYELVFWDLRPNKIFNFYKPMIVVPLDECLNSNDVLNQKSHRTNIFALTSSRYTVLDQKPAVTQSKLWYLSRQKSLTANQSKVHISTQTYSSESFHCRFMKDNPNGWKQSDTNTHS